MSKVSTHPATNVAGLSATLLTAVCALPAAAQPGGNTNAVADGAYAAAATWDNGVPTGTTDAQMANGYTVTSSLNNSAFRILLGDDPAGSTGTLTIAGGILGTDRAVSLGGFETASTGTGILNIQSGGTLDVGLVGPGGAQDIVVGDVANTTGILNLDGGTANAAGFIIVGRVTDANGSATGTLNQTAGDINSLQLRIGGNATGTHNFDGGTVNNRFYSLGVGPLGSGTTNQSAGTLTAEGINVGDNGSGTYNMTGGTVNQTAANLGIIIGGLGVNANGTFDQSGGTVTATNLRVGNGNDSTGTLTLSGDATIRFTSLDIASELGLAGNTASNVTGTLNLNGPDVTITGTDLDANGSANTAALNWLVDDGGVSTISLLGAADLTGALLGMEEDAGENVAFGSTFTLIDGQSITGGFVDNSAAYDFAIVSGGSGQQLIATNVVPEPGTVVLLSLGGLALAARRRKA